MKLAAAVLLTLVATSLLGPTPPASASPERQVVLIVVPGLSYGDALADPLLRRLARAGGIGLLTTSGGADLPARTAIGIGAGRPAPEMADGPVRIREEGTGLRVSPPPGIRGVEPGLLGSALAQAGLAVAYADLDAPGSTPGGLVAPLVAMDRRGAVPLAARTEAAATEALAVADLVVGDDLALVPLALARTAAREVLVLVVGAGASAPMLARGETVDAIVLARGAPEHLLDPDGRAGGLTSGTTRRAGVVAEVDVAPTILRFLGIAPPPTMIGAAIRVTGAPPTDLHRRWLELQRVAGPAGLAALAFGLLVLAAALALTFGRRRGPAAGRANRPVLVAVVLSISLLVAMLPASWLPSFAPLPVGLTLAGASVGIAVLALALARGDARAAVATVAAVGLGLVVLDAALGWPSELTPMLGGGVLDGERFFGLGNAYAGIVLAGAVLGAARLPARVAPWLLIGAAAFAGLPFLGADLGGSATLAAAAGLWVGLGRWRSGARPWLLGLAGLAAGALLTMAADRVLPGGGTHVSHATGGLGAALRERFLANVRTTSATPAAWLTVAGLGAWLALASRTPLRLLGALEADPRWRRAIVVLSAGGLIGWVVNDTYGLAGSAFAFACAAVLAPALQARRPATG